MATINVVATVRVRPEAIEEFEAVVARTRPLMLADPGCLRYDLQQRRGEAGTYVLLECYDSGEALQRHGSSAEFAEFGRAIGSLVTGAPEIVLLVPVAVANEALLRHCAIGAVQRLHRAD